MTDQDLYQHGGMLLRHRPVGESYGMAQLSPANNANGFIGEAAAPNFQLVVAGDTQGRCAGLWSGIGLVLGKVDEADGGDVVCGKVLAEEGPTS